MSDEDFEVIRLAVENDVTDREFWWSRTPDERIYAMELMRRRKYGYDESSMPRIQKVFEVRQMKKYTSEDGPHKT